MDESALAQVEQQRLELESRIAQLRKSLRYWQTLELDYEGLREELQGLRPDSTSAVCLRVVQDFGAELVDEKELQALIERHRQPQQIANLLSKRVEYCGKNEETLKSQLSDAEKKRNALLLANEPAFRDEAGLPLTEITEELDHEGHVVSTRLQTPDTAAPQLAEVLRKAGVKGITDEHGVVTAKEGSIGAQGPGLEKPARSAPNVSSTDPVLNVQSNDTEEEAALRTDMLQYGLDEVGAIVAELDLEDAGSDGSFDHDVDDDVDLSDLDDEDSDEEESEDEKGMTKSLLIPDSYRRKMERLEKKLGLKDMQNVGPNPELPTAVQNSLARPAAAEAARKAALARAEAGAKDADSTTTIQSETSRPRAKPKKTVAFAESLDITPKSTGKPVTQGVASQPNPVQDSVMERVLTAPAAAVASGSSTPVERISRFKAARADTPQTPLFKPPNMGLPAAHTAPTPPVIPHDTIIAALIVERANTSDSKTVSAPDPDSIDDELHQREIAIEHRRLHNRMMHRQGGFVHDGEEDNYGDATAAVPTQDDETGKVKKVSRFKAARVK